jgi:hypothetical protein
MRAPADLLAVWRMTLSATRVNGHYRYDPMHRRGSVLAGRLQTLLRFKAQPKQCISARLHNQIEARHFTQHMSAHARVGADAQSHRPSFQGT